MLRINNIRRTAMIGSVVLFSFLSGKAFIAELLESYIKSSIKDWITGYLDNKTSGLYSQIKNFSWSDLWGEVVDENARNSIAQKAATIADFYPLEIGDNYSSFQHFVYQDGNISAEKTFDYVMEETIENFHEDLASVSDISFSEMGNGYLREKSCELMAERTEANHAKGLSDVLQKDVLTRIESNGGRASQKEILSDINSHPGLIPAFNSNPEAVDFYFKLKPMKLNANPQELTYWAQQADGIRPKLSPKNKLIVAGQLSFTPKDKEMEISLNGNVLAYYIPGSRTYRVVSPEFLNFAPRANHTYIFGSTTFNTDPLGRVKMIEFYGNKKANKMAGKNPVKFNDLATAKNGTAKDNLYSDLLKEFGVTPAMAYTGMVYDSKELKTNLKAFQKELKNELKSNADTKVRLTISYSDYTDTPSALSIATYNGTNKELLNNHQAALKFP